MKTTKQLKNEIKELNNTIKEKENYIDKKSERIDELETEISNIKELLNIKSSGYLSAESTIFAEIMRLKGIINTLEAREHPQQQTIGILHRIIRVALKDETLIEEVKNTSNIAMQDPMNSRFN